MGALVQVQRELRRAQSESALADAKARKRQAVQEVKSDLDRIHGRDVTRSLKECEAATADAVVEVAEQLNEKLSKLAGSLPDGKNQQGPLWYALFKHMDQDGEAARSKRPSCRCHGWPGHRPLLRLIPPERRRPLPAKGRPSRHFPPRLTLHSVAGSGMIAYGELRQGLRQQLRLSKAELPEARLRGLWKALDADASGWISCGEFGKFMRSGEGKGQKAKVRCVAPLPQPHVTSHHALATHDPARASSPLCSRHASVASLPAIITPRLRRYRSRRHHHQSPQSGARGACARAAEGQGEGGAGQGGARGAHGARPRRPVCGRGGGRPRGGRHGRHIPQRQAGAGAAA